MSEQGMKRLEKLYISKIRSRIGEINERFILTNSTPVTDFAVSKSHAERQVVAGI